MAVIDSSLGIIPISSVNKSYRMILVCYAMLPPKRTGYVYSNQVKSKSFPLPLLNASRTATRDPPFPWIAKPEP
jgi:hypothetical protein